jgi:hypothetical protein
LSEIVRVHCELLESLRRAKLVIEMVFAFAALISQGQGVIAELLRVDDGRPEIFEQVSNEEI